MGTLLHTASRDLEKPLLWMNPAKDGIALQMMFMSATELEALQIIFAATLEEGSKVLAPGPHYPPYMAYPQMYGAATIEYSLKSDDGWSIDLDDIESKMDSDVRLLVLINPNNPTGNVASVEEIDKLLNIAKSGQTA